MPEGALHTNGRSSAGHERWAGAMARRVAATVLAALLLLLPFCAAEEPAYPHVPEWPRERLPLSLRAESIDATLQALPQDSFLLLELFACVPLA